MAASDLPWALVGFEYATCDECGQDTDDCECIVCIECNEFTVGALTKDQNLTLCESCAKEMEVELIN